MGLFSSVLIMMLEKFYVRVWGQSSQHCMPRSFFSQLLESPLQGHFPKSIAQKWNWPRKGGAFSGRDKVLVSHGTDCGFHSGQGEDFFQMPWAGDRSLAWLSVFTLPTSHLLFSTKRETKTAVFLPWLWKRDLLFLFERFGCPWALIEADNYLFK